MKSLHNEDGSMRFIKRMKAHDLIDATQDYLDYVGEHINNVQKAFIRVTDACEGMIWVGDDASWHALRTEVESHDVSKLSAEEFTQYRDRFYPVSDEVVGEQAFDAAWEHHKANNPHHHEVARTHVDIVHMIIDWTAMGYKFGDTAQAYYEANEDKISLEPWQVDFMYEIFEKMGKAESQS